MGMKLSNNLRFDKITSRGFDVRTGSGNSRKTFALSSTDDFALLRWLLCIRGNRARGEIIQSGQKLLGVPHDECVQLVDRCIEMGILEDGDPNIGTKGRSAFELLEQWSMFGWQDAAEFHLACRELEFVPDSECGDTYKEIYSRLKSSSEIVGEQLPHYSPKQSSSRLTIPSKDLDRNISLAEVFSRACPINKFRGSEPSLDGVVGAICDGFATQRIVSGSLGEHQNRPYPSGGARHPLELYVLVQSGDKGRYAVYWFDPLTQELNLHREDITKRQIDNACFGKGGVVSSNVLVVLTCRWLRHSWKYRYSRSYRMVLLELGHAVQSLNLNFRARGIDVFQCPSIDDAKWTELLALEDNCNEAPLYVLSLGTGGTL